MLHDRMRAILEMLRTLKLSGSFAVLQILNAASVCLSVVVFAFVCVCVGVARLFNPLSGQLLEAMPI